MRFVGPTTASMGEWYLEKRGQRGGCEAVGQIDLW